MNTWDKTGILVGVIWLLPAGVLLWTLRTNHHGTPLRAKLVIAGIMLTGSVGALAGGGFAAWRTPQPLHFADYTALLLWLAQTIIWVWLFRAVLVRMREEARKGITRRARPSFFLEGLLILLPVTVLAPFGLASLKQDERAAELEERRKAAQQVAILGQIVRSSVSEDLEQYVIAQNEWMSEMHSASQPAVKMQFPDEILKT